MLGLPQVRPEERALTIASFLALFGIMAGHTLLETSRDALFVARLPASHLPVVYLAIVVVGLAIARTNRRVVQRSGPAVLALGLFAAAAVTAAFWFASRWKGTWFLYALYVWSGVIASWIMIQFWLTVGSAFTVIQAKRLFGLIGAGSVLGAVVGAVAARALVASLPPEHLLLGSAVLFAATGAAASLLLRVPAAGERPRSIERAAPAPRGRVPAVLRDRYFGRILVITLVSTVTLTLIDFLFKAVAKERVPAAELGVFFANAYVVFNVASLFVQVVVVGWLLRTFGVQRALWVMPVVVAATSAAFALGGGLIAALVLKGADGAFRHSLHGTATELLFVPTQDAERAQAKPLIDLVGRRGGQALASLAILGMVFIGVGHVGLAIASGALAAAWFVAVLSIRRPYLDVFRDTLRRGKIDYEGALPPFDLGALEALISALNSSKDPEVIGALDLLEAQKRPDLVPALVLFHPSDPIVLRALDVLSGAQRDDIAPIADRLLGHSNPEVQSAAVRARMAVVPDRDYLARCLGHASPGVRATALVGMMARDWIDEREAGQMLAQVVTAAEPDVVLALARAIAAEPSPRFIGVLEGLLEHPQRDVRAAAIRAIGQVGDTRFIPRLVGLLGQRHTGIAAREALAAIGEPALAYLRDAMRDDSLAIEIQRNLPRALALFDPVRAAPILIDHLVTSHDDVVRYRVVRALSKLRADEPELALDPARLDGAVEDTVRDAVGQFTARMTIQRSAAELDPSRRLIVSFLRDKEAETLARIFRLLGLRHPGENFVRIHRGLARGNPKAQASGCELIENVIEPPLSRALLALVGDHADPDRLALVPSSLRPPSGETDRALAALRRAGPELAALIPEGVRDGA